MIKTYTENVVIKDFDGNITHQHTKEYEYDTEAIKEECCVCFRLIGYDEERYKQRGNYCQECNANTNSKYTE